MGWFQIDVNKARKITAKADPDGKKVKKSISDINYWIAYSAIQGQREYSHYDYLTIEIAKKLHKYYSDLGFTVVIENHCLQPYYLVRIIW